jgi:hypothetical protein
MFPTHSEEVISMLEGLFNVLALLAGAYILYHICREHDYTINDDDLDRILKGGDR